MAHEIRIAGDDGAVTPERLAERDQLQRHRFDAQARGRDGAAAIRTERADVRPLRKHFYRRMGPKGFSSGDIDASLDELMLAIARMEGALARHRWIVGEAFSIADVVIAPTIDRLDDLGLARLWDKHARVADWYERLKARPSYAKAFYPGSRISASGVTVAPLPNAAE